MIEIAMAQFPICAIEFFFFKLLKKLIGTVTLKASLSEGLVRVS